MVGCKPIYGGSIPSLPSMKMHEWTTNQWLQWIYSDREGGNNLLYDMDNWPYPILENLIREVDLFVNNYWNFNCPLWLDDTKVFSVYNRLFTILRVANLGKAVRVMVDDVDDGDNVYILECNNHQEAMSMTWEVYSEFAKDKTVLACSLMLELLTEWGFKKE